MKHVRRVVTSLVLTVLFVAVSIFMFPAPSSASSANFCAIQAGTVNGQFKCLSPPCQTSVCCIDICPETGDPQALPKT